MELVMIVFAFLAALAAGWAIQESARENAHINNQED